MSETDSFIHEVTDEIRRDRLFKFFRKYLWVFIALVVLIIGGTIVNEYLKAQKRSAAIELGEAFAAAQDSGGAAGFAEIATTDAPAFVLAKMEQASELVIEGQADAALDIYQSISADNQVAPIYKDLALLKSVMIAGDHMEQGVLLDIIDRLSAQGAPFRLLAIEQRAVMHLKNGDTESALSDLAQIIADPLATQGLRNRAQELTIALGAELPTQGNTEISDG